MKNAIVLMLSVHLAIMLAACGGGGTGGGDDAPSACTDQDLALVVEGQVTNHSAETFMIDIRKANAGPVHAGGDGVVNEVLSYRGGDDAINFSFESLFVYLRAFSDAVGTYAVKDYGDNGGSSDPPPSLSPGEAAVPGLSEPFRPTSAEYDIGPARGGTVTIQSFDAANKTIHLTFDLEYPLGGRLKGCLRTTVVGTTEPTPDAGLPTPDAGPVDAMFSAPAFGTFIVNEIDMPTDATTADQYGFDLDGDGYIDNQMGNILSALAVTGGASQSTLTADVRDGTILLLAASVGCTDGPCLSTFAGTSPSPAPCTVPGDPSTCGQHLQGTATFTIDSAQPTDLATHGTFDGSTFVGTSGSLVFPIVVSDGPPVWVDLLLAHAHIGGIGTGFGPSTLGGAIPEAEVQSRIVPAMHAGIAADIQRDCTGVGANCGCIDGSTGATLLGIFDGDGDCSVSLFEFSSNALIGTLMRPDVDTDGDGQPDAISIGVQVTGAAATFTLP